MAEKCKHDCGWCVLENTYIFVFDEHDKYYPNKVSMDFQHGKTMKIVARCNNTSCNKVRNIYLKPEVDKWGKIRNPTPKELEILGEVWND